MIYELTYESVAKKGLLAADVHAILETSRARNVERGITGCLVYYNRRFIQILEGNQQTLQECYQKIQKDSRHRQVRIIAENAVEKRTFSEWGMAYFPIDENNVNHSELEQFRRNLKLLADFSKPESLSSILFWVKVKALLAEPPGLFL
ncbi:Sensors of blue-light using FAD [Pricia antarctica]|uniref:Sensors of blue-light using FAD n=1 Tax=Pricia antarctica TaxID=641691 RepID=A0A1G7J7Q9_9FLAO|nr:BLUF domain-containing protein [Pricia antarctica]SDF20905.1 Sensors of blue-light using FAD [Pricia antarctica]